MKNTKKNLGPIQVYLSRDQVNGLLSMLDTLKITGYDTAFGDMAKVLRDKILKYGKPIQCGDMDQVLIYFYDNEAERLITLVSLYLALTASSMHDFYPEIGQRYRQGFGNPQAAEQTEAPQ